MLENSTQSLLMPLDFMSSDDRLWLSNTFTRWQARLDICCLSYGINEDEWFGDDVGLGDGFFLAHIKNLSFRWMWAESKVFSFIKELENSGLIDRVKKKERGWVYRVTNPELFGVSICPFVVDQEGGDE